MVLCEIKFLNNVNAIYFAGQVVQGQVTLTLDKPKKLKGKVVNQLFTFTLI